MAYVKQLEVHDVWSGLAALISSITLYWISVWIYNLYFHPLAKFSGPITWRASRLPYMRATWVGHFPHVIHELHKQYGDIVRTAPNELSCRGLAAWDDIYSNSKGKAFSKSEILQVFQFAFDHPDPTEQHLDLRAHLETSTGLLLPQRGFFDRAEPYLTRVLHQKAEADPVDRIKVCWAQVNLATALCSLGRNEEALKLQLSTLNHFQEAGDDDESATLSPRGLLYRHIGRSKYLVGQPADARVWLNLSQTTLTGSKNFASIS